MDSDGKPQGLHLRPHKGTYLGSFYFLNSGNQNLTRRALPDKTCPTRLARQRPTVKQKPDSSPQPAPTSRGAVCSSARKHPDGNS
ncbi:hypothetical protein ACFXTO_040512 [Malus domestica]